MYTRVCTWLKKSLGILFLRKKKTNAKSDETKRNETKRVVISFESIEYARTAQFRTESSTSTSQHRTLQGYVKYVRAIDRFSRFVLRLKQKKIRSPHSLTFQRARVQRYEHRTVNSLSFDYTYTYIKGSSSSSSSSSFSSSSSPIFFS